MKRLEGKVAVISGATSGMALATAKLFVEEGAYVFITGRRQQQLDEAVKAIGKNVTGVQGDAGKLADLDRLYDTVRAKKGHIDILYASAGVGDFGIPIGSVTEESFDKTFDVNVRGTLFTDRLHRRCERLSGDGRLQREQSRCALFCPHLDQRSKRPENSRERPQPRLD